MWIIFKAEQPPEVGTIMVRHGHGGQWQPYHPALDRGELQAGVVDKNTETSTLILVDGEFPREKVGVHLEDALAAGLLKGITFTETAGG